MLTVDIVAQTSSFMGLEWWFQTVFVTGLIAFVCYYLGLRKGREQGPHPNVYNVPEGAVLSLPVGSIIDTINVVGGTVNHGVADNRNTITQLKGSTDGD